MTDKHKKIIGSVSPKTSQALEHTNIFNYRVASLLLKKMHVMQEEELSREEKETN